MDGFSGYNQIKMYHDDEKHTSFRTPLGVYFSRYIRFLAVWMYISPDMSLKMEIQCDFLEAPFHGIQC